MEQLTDEQKKMLDTIVSSQAAYHFKEMSKTYRREISHKTDGLIAKIDKTTSLEGLCNMYDDIDMLSRNYDSITNDPEFTRDVRSALVKDIDSFIVEQHIKIHNSYSYARVVARNALFIDNHFPLLDEQWTMLDEVLTSMHSQFMDIVQAKLEKHVHSEISKYFNDEEKKDGIFSVKEADLRAKMNELRHDSSSYDIEQAKRQELMRELDSYTNYVVEKTIDHIRNMDPQDRTLSGILLSEVARMEENEGYPELDEILKNAEESINDIRLELNTELVPYLDHVPEGQGLSKL